MIDFNRGNIPGTPEELPNYLEELTLRLEEALAAITAPRWDDLRFPATALNPPGAASDPGVESTSGLLLFAATGQELIFALAQMPHAWLEGSAIKPHVHWTKTSSASGDVAWQLRYQVLPIGEVGPGSWTSLGIESTEVAGTPDNDTSWEHLITSWDEIPMDDGTDSYKVSTCILFELSRMGSDASDTYGADARLLEFDVHFQIDSFGSVFEYIKG